MIHQGRDGKCVISSHGVWIPGVYADRRTANYAFRFSDDQLLSIWNPKITGDPGRRPVITFEELRELRRKLKEPT